MVEPGLDEFPGEKLAMELEAGLGSALRSGQLQISADCAGGSPMPSEYGNIAPSVATAVFGDQLAKRPSPKR